MHISFSKALRVVAVAAMVHAVALPAWADLPANFNPADYLKPESCGAFYEFKGSACQLKTAEVSALPQKECEAAKFKFTAATTGSPASCSAGNDLPVAECKAVPGYNAKRNGAGTAATCSYERALPSSTLGDYVSDCMTVKSVPPGTELAAEKVYFVTSQRPLEDGDRELTLVPGAARRFPWGCRANGQQGQHLVTASALMKGGALREGYTYGFLTMPYKYFPSKKSFTASAPVGGYLGWRNGQAGSGFTLAAAMTIGSVKADTVDPTKPDTSTDSQFTVTGSADVAALSGAVGVMFDILKSGTGKPFKAGFFLGKDRVSTDPTVYYRFNRKTWLAFQIGYDFTDN